MIHVIACPHCFSPSIFGCLKNYPSKVYCTRDFILRHATFEFNTIENVLIHTKNKTTATWVGPIVVRMCDIATIRHKRRWMGFSALAGIHLLFFPPATKPILLDWRRDSWCSWYALLWKPVFTAGLLSTLYIVFFTEEEGIGFKRGWIGRLILISWGMSRGGLAGKKARIRSVLHTAE